MGLGTSSFLSLWGLLVVFFLFQPASAAMTPNCPRGWVSYGTGCFGYFSVLMTWGDAEVACQNYGSSGHLASIHSPQEMGAIANYMSQSHKGTSSVWIGLYDTKRTNSFRNREFKWTDGSRPQYMPWNAGEPNAWQAKEFCGELLSNGFTLWNDGICTTRQPYLCKFEPGLAG